MNKKIFGIKISTILQAVLCIIVAFVIWFAVKYTGTAEKTEETAFLPVDVAVSSYETL